MRQVPNSFSAMQSLAANSQAQRPLRIKWEKGQVWCLFDISTL
ncbi:hypothetical protein BHECKSOX2_318 [Bathymodiolus heckerae thiotrophic gill symbiont]|nr:hypothetical protein BHECKSOX2_318 [Bathymodiolus heckerae thiotrophic gill symbiont]